jgi:molybdopterin converting factor small subunit
MKILCFGITREIIGQFEYEIALKKNAKVKDLKAKLITQFPDFQRLSSVNTEYANDETPIKPTDEIVLIPPVSGG